MYFWVYNIYRCNIDYYNNTKKGIITQKGGKRIELNRIPFVHLIDIVSIT